MEVISKRPLGVGDTNARLQASVCTKTTTNMHPSLVFSRFTNKARRFKYRNKYYGFKTRNRTRASTKLPGFLYHNLFGAKKEWQASSCHQSKTLKQVSGDTSVQNADHPQHCKGSDKGRVCGVNRFGRRVLSHSNSQVVSEIPEICLQRSSMAVSVPPVRPSDESVRVYPGGLATSEVPTTVISSVTSVSGRLVDRRNNQGQNTNTAVDNSQSDNGNGLVDKQREIGINSITAVHLSGRSVLSAFESDVSSAGPLLQGMPGNSEISQSERDDFVSMAVTDRADTVYGRPGTSGSPACKTSVFLSKFTSDEECRPGISGVSISTSQGSPLVVAQRESCTNGGSNRHYSSPSSLDNRLVINSMGCSPHNAGRLGCHSYDSGDMGRDAFLPAYQCKGAESGSRSPNSMGGFVNQSMCQGGDRQQNDYVSDKQTGNSQVSNASPNDGRSSHLDIFQGDTSKSGISAGVSQCSGGPTVQAEQSTAKRVVIASPGSGEIIPKMGSSSRGSVCDQSKLQITNLREPNEGSQRICRGRSIHRLEGNVRLRLPSTKDSTTSHAKGRRDKAIHHDFDRALLAKDAVVFKRSRLRPRRSATVTSQNAPKPEAGKRSHNDPLKSTGSQPTRVEVVKQSLKDQGFSAAVASRVSESATRTSTNEVYDSRWKAFQDWCSDNNLDPVNCTIPKVADFLLFLFKKRGGPRQRYWAINPPSVEFGVQKAGMS